MAEAGKSKVLIVDDEDVVREFLERFFVQKGMEVALAESGERAMELARREKFDLAFLDVRMPKLNGLETLKELKVISPDTTYVMMTGYAVDDLLREAERHGAASSIKKPFDINKLSTLLDGFDLRKADRKEMGILVVDDDNIVAGFFKGLLHEYNIVTAASGREALDRLEERDFDLIFWT
jgi:DNA-binding NtrC family response regulator